MDITTTTTSTTTVNTPTTKSPEPESEARTRIQQAKPLSFTNGLLKRHYPLYHHNHHHHQQLPGPPIVVTYKECLKNHAASLGGHAIDGCGEFMPSPNATHTDPTSLKCAACGCHRNFHRREPEGSPPPITTTTTIEYQPHHRHHPPPPPPQVSQPNRSPNSASPPPISSSYYPSAPHMLLALSGGVSGLNDNANRNLSARSSARKRFRTKFSESQKERMHQFAERVGWKMQKHDEELVKEFCNEVGVNRGVLKVWMHNNKNNFGKRPDINGNSTRSSDLEITHNSNSNNNNTAATTNDNGSEGGVNHRQLFDDDSLAHVGANGSSSSS